MEVDYLKKAKEWLCKAESPKFGEEDGNTFKGILCALIAIAERKPALRPVEYFDNLPGRFHGWDTVDREKYAMIETGAGEIIRLRPNHVTFLDRDPPAEPQESKTDGEPEFPKCPDCDARHEPNLRYTLACVERAQRIRF
jgi:hypothetical protein